MAFSRCEIECTMKGEAELTHASLDGQVLRQFMIPDLDKSMDLL